MSDATTPADPTDQIAATPAVLSPEPPIVPTSGTKRVPDDSEVTDWREDWTRVQSAILGLEWTEAKQSALDRLAAHIERLEAERDALLAEHEAWTAWRMGEPSTSRNDWNRLTNAHANAERVIRGER